MKITKNVTKRCNFQTQNAFLVGVLPTGEVKVLLAGPDDQRVEPKPPLETTEHY